MISKLMNSHRYCLLGTSLALIATIIMSGCANSKKSHRDATGVLKTETRAEMGIHKPDK